MTSRVVIRPMFDHLNGYERKDPTVCHLSKIWDTAVLIRAHMSSGMKKTQKILIFLCETSANVFIACKISSS